MYSSYFNTDFRSFAAEEALEQMEAQLEEANEVAKMSNQKFEDAGRKLKVTLITFEGQLPTPLVGDF